MQSAPYVTLKNGLRIVNFSSPHPFVFEDGSTLPACDKERVDALSLDTEEVEIKREGQSWVDIKLEIKMTANVMNELLMLEADREIDIVLVPFMVLEAINKVYILEKPRVIRVKDRVTKVLYCDKFCI